MARPWVGYLAAAGSVLIIAASCTQDFDAFFQGPETITATTSGSGATSSTTTQSGGGGSTGECTAPDDCSGISTTCRYKTCESQVCGWESAAEGTTCTETPGQNVCNGSGTCVECNVPTDCPNASDLCQSNECVPPHCGDQSLNEDETDVDCGGLDCAPCADTLACLVFSDCVSQFCDNLVCAPCADDTDCTDATDTWCDPTANSDNGGCVDQLAQGFGCTRDGQCLTGFCTDGACCVVDDCPPGPCASCNKANFEGACENLDLGASCSDGDYCNGSELCNASGICNPGTAPCTGPDDDDDCAESCDEVANNCLADDPNTSACDDGDYCNGDDTCIGGTCTPSNVDPCPGPDDDDDCSESCDPAGNCTAYDGEDATCDDGTYCNGADTCISNVCTPSNIDPCPGPDCDANCYESCDPIAGNCTAYDGEGEACQQGGNCNEHCVSGNCQ